MDSLSLGSLGRVDEKSEYGCNKKKGGINYLVLAGAFIVLYYLMNKYSGNKYDYFGVFGEKENFDKPFSSV